MSDQKPNASCIVMIVTLDNIVTKMIGSMDLGRERDLLSE